MADLEAIFAVFKLLDKNGEVYIHHDMLHLIPAEVTRRWYEPYCELLATYGMTNPTPKVKRYGFYVMHSITAREWLSTPGRLVSRTASSRYRELQENVGKLQLYDNLKARPDFAGKNNNSNKQNNALAHQWRSVRDDPFVKQWDNDNE